MSKGELTRRRIVAQAAPIFNQKGFAGTALSDLMQATGLEKGGIYRHFESKDQLFFEAVVDPLRQAVDDLVAASEVGDRDEPLTPDRQIATLQGLYRKLIATRLPTSSSTPERSARRSSS